MPLNSNVKITEVAGIVDAVPPVSAPASANGKWVSLKQYNRLSCIITAANGTTVTGTSVGFQQATDLSGTNAKTLPFTTYDANTDTAANDTFTATAAASNAFTTNSTNSKNSKYAVHFRAQDLDVANSFSTLRVQFTGSAVAQVLSAVYVLYAERYGDATPPTAVA